MLEQCGWHVQDYGEMNLSAGTGIAVCEFPLATGFADYLLYANGKAIGVVEAKPEGHPLVSVEDQTVKYATGLPEPYPAWLRPLPFTYETTGTETQFTSHRDPVPRSRPVFAVHRPEELVRLVQQDSQLRANLRAIPPLKTQNLWAKQITAIENLEESLARNQPRALVQMATGSGKTFTACNMAYRLIRFGQARRILFLVDRNNLGRQTLNEFQQFQSPHNAYKFTEEYGVHHLLKNTVPESAKVVITTIQRLYSILKGEAEYDAENEEASMFEVAPVRPTEPLPVVYNAKIPPEFFDVIIVDECHRSIYNVWRQVLEYFDAFIIGLTATPSAQTIGFFQENMVMEYTHEQAVLDHVNVGYDIYRIETKISRDGAALSKKPGFFVPRRDRLTRKRRYAELDDDMAYAASQLDRDVVNPSQLRLVIQTFRDRLFTQIFPGRTEVPKTLVFAKTDLHAEDVTRIIREEFGMGNDFCQKITSKSTGAKPEELLKQFRNSYFPRIAVTVDMIATGTDVKPLECLLFLRNISSSAYFEQMKGRGVRVLKPDDLRSVTPDAHAKTRFVIVDAVGVTETAKTISQPLDRKPSFSTAAIMQSVAAGVVNADVVSTLASRLTRLDRQITEDQRQQIAQQASGRTPAELAAALLDSIDPDRSAARAAQMFELPSGDAATKKQLDDAEHAAMAAALKPFHHPALRDIIECVRASTEQVIDEVNRDKLIHAGMSRKDAGNIVQSFREFIAANREQIEALRVLYSVPYRHGLRYGQVKELARKLAVDPFHVDAEHPETLLRLWNAYAAMEPQKVHGRASKLVDLIALVRHAIAPDTTLEPVETTVEQRYASWLAEKDAKGIAFTPEQRRWLDAIKNHIAACLAIGADDLEDVPFNQFGGPVKAYEVFGDRLYALLDELNERLVA